MQDLIVDPGRPNVSYGCMAAIVAPALATAVVAAIFVREGGIGMTLAAVFSVFIWALMIAAAHVLLLGLPAYLLLRRFTTPGWLLCGASGFVLGTAPISFLSTPAAARLDELTPTLIFAAMGLIAGLAFRWKLHA
jgi:hypothetical protein